LLAGVGTLHSRSGKWLDVKQSVILEEIRISRDGLDHICSYEGRGCRRESSDTAEYETQFADPWRPGTGTRTGALPGRRPAQCGRKGWFLGILGAGPVRPRSLALNLLQGHEATCPHCWETISLTLDLSVPEQSYIEDCPVCCKPMLVSYSAADGELDALSVDPSD
jgi:hypothetical protein